ncbi:hypothetical protein CAPTEDRAFT_179088 [Capitella teleta]|uniref:Uncharacterized protein n=1 Tax=Capitella teleta TaxID=283909 RepID=R7TTH9_CAPTE|nr:hypothetical protein CAPTEDRAFT_179088 [Capitella teleta]|eukprot:ELT94295.1 hypothetical protein CAPTEDRAFT_179088 [Capitella teleta]
MGEVQEPLQWREKGNLVADTKIQDKAVVITESESNSVNTSQSHSSLTSTRSPKHSVADKTANLQHMAIGWDHIIFLSDDGRLTSSSWNTPSKTQFERYSSVASSWNAVYLVNKQGQCHSANHGQELLPLPCESSTTNLTKIAAGETDVVAIDDRAQVHLLQKDAPIFKQIVSPKILIKSVSCGHEHTILLSKIGIVFTFGSGSRGQLGHGTIESQTQPQKVAALEGMSMTSVSAGGWHSAALSDIGDIYTWGWNERGQLGARSKGVKMKVEPESIESVRPAKIQKTQTGGIPSNYKDEEVNVETVNVQSIPSVLDVEDENHELLSFKDIACGSRHSAAVTDDGSLYSWGCNDYGQLGLGDRISRDSPTKVIHFSKNVIDVRCGYWNTIVECALT